MEVIQWTANCFTVIAAAVYIKMICIKSETGIKPVHILQQHNQPKSVQINDM